MKTKIFSFFILTFYCFINAFAQEISVDYKFSNTYFPLVTQSKAATIFVDPSDFKVVNIAANALQGDIFDISNQKPAVSTSGILSSYPIVIGSIGHSKLIDSLIQLKKINAVQIKNKWEAFTLQVIDQPFKNVKKALVIAGSDRRGTAFGVFEISKLLGISPWKWWADVHPEKHSSIYLRPGKIVQGSPSVKYRGIFINDEDWGLQPWAAKNMDTDIKDIGPKTYAKVLELLLRLKANFIWPAMHPSTKAFYYYKDNPKLADDYAIVVGSSHAEPMLRNNVFEWAVNFENEYGRKPGEWRYDSNGKEILQYWSDRVDQSKSFESVYTIGMRGVHDSGMPGPKSTSGKLQLLQEVIRDQRNLLQTAFKKPASDIPQIFCPYKEVLDIYRNGLQLPDDVTIVWADDNHGYIRQLSNDVEQKRGGGSGIYYHLSYWGSPHDYLWLSSVSPSLISYEMTKAYDYGADRLWVFNIGDIKPAEMELEFAMDLAWNKNQWSPEKAYTYAEYWATKTFGKEYSKEIAALKNTYYQLAASAKPEHLGLVSFTKAEENERLKKYGQIAIAAEQLKNKIPSRLLDAFFETIYYPVVGAKLMNEKFIYARKSLDLSLPADSALHYASVSTKAFQQIQQLTDQYNLKIAGGKWNGIMSWHPRDLPVYFMPKVADKKYLDSLRGIVSPPLAYNPKLIIDASNFSSKRETNGVHFSLINNLGINGKGVTTMPFNRKPDLVISKAPYLEYKLKLSSGKHTIVVKCLPTQSIDSDKKLQFGISVNNNAIQTINIHSESDSRQWKENVLRGYAEGTINYTASSETTILRIYFPEPGLVINTIEIE
jgi:hypothetical protein